MYRNNSISFFSRSPPRPEPVGSNGKSGYIIAMVGKNLVFIAREASERVWCDKVRATVVLMSGVRFFRMYGVGVFFGGGLETDTDTDTAWTRLGESMDRNGIG